MLSLYEILKASKTGIAPDMWTALAGMNWGGKDSGAEVKKLTGIPPLSIRSNGTMLLDYLISGNMSQTGTPTTPIQPQETGERTAQLFDGVLYEGFYNDNGQLVIDASHASHTNLITADTQTTYTVSNLWQTAPNFAVYEWDANKQWLRRTNRQTPPSNKMITFTLSNDCAYFSLQINSNYDYTKLMLNTGSQPLPYEPFGVKIPISSANTTTPIYLGEVETTRKVKKLVLDGTESWTYESQYSRFVLIRTDAYYSGAVRTTPCNCSHYQPIYDGRTIDNVPNESIYITSSSGRTAFNIKSTDFTSVTDFKAYLAAQYANGTPVTIWYVLATPTTGIVNEPLRKIGDYADTLSMEQAGVQIPTLHGNTVIDVETTLKPSQMYIKYQE